MITLFKWIGAAGAGALFMLIVFYYTSHNQQKQEVKIDVQQLKTEKMVKDFENDEFFTPDKNKRAKLDKESEDLAKQIDDKQKSIIIRQEESDLIVTDAKKALKDLDKDLKEKTGTKKLDIKP